ncbi:hypothetical protein GH714_016920 [Hevea brasiliensis]|uniref:Thioredoxin domain-containing protein n=1 Tax=Hevea brasiliensis TaxID=3981 RepID=A0A6A6KCC9_HEVBR|nr:hypothetical protein GH714_016920 [Hevea brasiliensis]
MMSLIRFSISPTTSVRSSPFSFPSSQLHPIVCSPVTKDSLSSSSSSSKLLNSSSTSSFSLSLKDVKRNCWAFRVRSSLDTVGPTATVDRLLRSPRTPSGPSSSPPAIKLSSLTCTLNGNIDVLSCGPCKVMAPKFKDLSENYLDVVFLKLDCNKDNKPLAKELGIRVVPTFKILKDSKIVREVTGAKFDDLVVAIEGVRSS